jgi:hypothetical protein
MKMKKPGNAQSASGFLLCTHPQEITEGNLASIGLIDLED